MNGLTLEKSILRAVAYFDMFHYPVTSTEIRLFLDRPVLAEEMVPALDELTLAGNLYRFQGLYSLRNDPSLVERRLKGEERAAALLPLAYRIGKILHRFPFIKGVGISGSLSKNYADENADIDFFIITSKERLWIARSLLHCLKKISYLYGRQHWFCMNYFIDEQALLMPERNRFIATELLTLKPVTGRIFDFFFAANTWALDELPNHVFPLCPVKKDARYKRWIEQLFDNRVGNWLDKRLMHITRNRWQRKEKKAMLDMKGTPMSILIERHRGRPNPCHFQKKILELYDTRLRDIENRLRDNPVISVGVK